MCRKHIIGSNWRNGLVSNGIKEKANGQLQSIRKCTLISNTGKIAGRSPEWLLKF
jgi:hypothetical protein